MSDLHKRIAEAITGHRDCSADATTGEWRYICDCGTVMATDNIDAAELLHEAHQADMVLTDLAAWLREQEAPVAEQLRDRFPNSTMADHWFGAQSVLHRLTDEIERKRARNGR